MIEVLRITGLLLLSWAVVGLGLIYAFCPINDRDTSTLHRAVTLTITSVVCLRIWGFV
jgi:cytochrome b